MVGVRGGSAGGEKMLQLGTSQQRSRYPNGCTWGTSSPDPHSCSSELLSPLRKRVIFTHRNVKAKPRAILFSP